MNHEHPTIVLAPSTAGSPPGILQAFSARCSRAAQAIASRAIDIAFAAALSMPAMVTSGIKRRAKQRKQSKFAISFWTQAQSAQGLADLLANPGWAHTQGLDASCELAMVFDEMIRHPHADDPRRQLCLTLLDPRTYPPKAAIDMACASLGWLAHLAANHATGIYTLIGQDGEPIGLDSPAFEKLAQDYFAIALPGLSRHLDRDLGAFASEDFSYFFSKATEHWERAENICANCPPTLIMAMHRLAQEREPHRPLPHGFSALIERAVIGHDADSPTPGKPRATRSL